jgi:hypothetical protein
MPDAGFFIALALRRTRALVACDLAAAVWSQATALPADPAEQPPA